MKKNSVWLIAAFIAAVVVAGCGSSAPAVKETATAQEAAPTVPDWLEDIPPRDALWGIGFIKLADETQAMQVATQVAQRAVAEQLGVLVQGMLNNYALTAGTANQESSVRAIENITRTLVNTSLSGATPNARKRMPDGTWWVRVSLQKADAKNAVTNIVDNQAAQFAEFKMRDALKNLDAELDKSQPKPLVRSGE